VRTVRNFGAGFGLARARLAEEEDQGDQGDRTHPGGDVERRADPEMRGGDAAHGGADGDAEELRALHARDGDRRLS